MRQLARIAPLFQAIVLTLVLAAPASAGGYYLDFFVGPNRTDETSFAVLGTSRIDTEFDTGLNYGVSFGYAFDKPWRFEGELMRREADVDTHNLNDGGSIPGSTGEAKSTALLANVFYDFRNKSRVTPYAGLGLGSVMVDYAGFAVPGLVALDDDDSVLGYQIMAGLAVKINERWAFRTDLRLLEAGDAELTSSAATGSTGSDVEYSSLDMTAGMRVRF